jgi:hypothetical protein
MPPLPLQAPTPSESEAEAKRHRLAALRAEVAALELELSRAPPPPPTAAPPTTAPPFEHTPYHHHRGNLGPEGLGWQHEPDEAALSTAELVASRAYARDCERHGTEEVIAGCSESIRRYGFCVVDHVVPRDVVPAMYDELSTGQVR